MLNKFNFSAAKTDYIFAIIASISSYYILQALHASALLELKKRTHYKLIISPSVEINLAHKRICIEIMLTATCLRGGDLTKVIAIELVKWLNSHIMKYLPEVVLQKIVYVTQLKIVKLIIAAIVGTSSVVQFKNVVSLANNTLFGINVTDAYPTFKTRVDSVIGELPTCISVPAESFEALIGYKIGGEQFEESIDSLISLLSDVTNGRNAPEIVVCIAMLLGILFLTDRRRFNAIVSRLWKAYMEGRLSKSRYLGIVKKLRRRGIHIPV